MQSTTWHYPHDLLSLMVNTIPKLVKSKRDVIMFFRGAGVDESILRPISAQLSANAGSVNKYSMARDVLQAVNALGSAGLEIRREIVKRVVEFRSFETCYENDVMAARGGVAAIQEYVKVRDTNTRLADSARLEREKSIAAAESKRLTTLKYQETRAEIKANLYALFSAGNASKRGKLFEQVLNDLFKLDGILIREAFTLSSHTGDGIVEQIDGVVEVHNYHWLVEAKWLTENVGVEKVSPHIVRVISRGGCAGMFVVYPGYTQAALDTVRDAMRETPWVLCDLEEIVTLLETGESTKTWLKRKINSAIVDRKPFVKYTP